MEAQSDLPTTEVPCGAGAFLHFDWGPGNSIDICSTGSDPVALRCDWSSLEFAERRPAHSLAPLYAELQRRKASGSAARLEDSVAAQYAERVASCFTVDSYSDQLPEDSSTVQLYQERAVWELMRICHLDSRHSCGVTQAFAVWLKRFHALYTPAAASTPSSELERLSVALRPEDDPAFWPLLHKLVALGRVDEAVDLLGAHSTWTVPYQKQKEDQSLLAEFTLVDVLTRLLRRMPQLCSKEADCLGGQIVAERQEFVETRGRWQAQLRELLKNAELWRQASKHSSATASGLEQVAAILCGSPEALSGATGTWLELLVAQLQHQYPDLAFQTHAGTLLQRCIQAKGEAEADMLRTVQDLMEMVGDQDFQGVMQICSSRLSPWLPAHLPDLLLQSPAAEPSLNSILAHLGCTQAEFFVLEYAASLLSGPSTWHLAVEYLAWCPRYGQARMAALVELVAASADRRTAQSLLRVCTMYELRSQFVTVCGIQAARAKNAGRLADGLEWALKANNLSLANSIAAKLLGRIGEAASSKDKGILSDVSEELGDLECVLRISCGTQQNPGTSNILAILLAFLTFQRGLNTGDLNSGAQAAQALEVLLEMSDFSPCAGQQQVTPQLGLDLLFLAVPLFESPSPVFQSSETQKLVRCLQDLQWRVSKEKAADAQTVGKLQTTQLALSRLLARVHLTDVR